MSCVYGTCIKEKDANAFCNPSCEQIEKQPGPDKKINISAKIDLKWLWEKFKKLFK